MENASEFIHCGKREELNRSKDNSVWGKINEGKGSRFCIRKRVKCKGRIFTKIRHHND